MRTFLIGLAIIVGMLAASVFMAASPSGAVTRVPASVCASHWTYTHLHSRTAHKCERQGFFYEVGSYVETDGHVVSWAIVVGPRGHVFVDTQNWIGR